MKSIVRRGFGRLSSSGFSGAIAFETSATQHIQQIRESPLLHPNKGRVLRVISSIPSSAKPVGVNESRVSEGGFPLA